MIKLKTPAAVREMVEQLIRTILISRTKREIVRAFATLECIVVGKCICDICPEWDSNVDIVYEYSRCLVPTRALQLIKARHCKSPRWTYVLPLYTSLFEKLIEDLHPLSGDISNGKLEDVACDYRLPKDLGLPLLHPKR